MQDKNWTLKRISKIDVLGCIWNCVMVLVVDEEQRIHYSSPLVNKFFGYIEGELDGKFLETMIPPEYRNIHKKHFARYFESPIERTMGTGTEQHTFEGIKKGGEKIRVSIWLTAMAPDGDKFIFATIMPAYERSTKMGL